MTLPRTTYILRFVHRNGSEIEEYEHPDELAARRHMDLFGKEDGGVFGSRVFYRNWLYHLDSYLADPGLARGIAGTGLVDMNTFRNVYPDHYFIDTGKPDKTYCAAFGTGLFTQDHCLYGLVLGRFAWGKGSVTVNTFKLMDNLGRDPIADILLCNLLRA